MKSNRSTTSEEFRLHLQQELVQRCQGNPYYSLRTFAKDLQVSPSALSAMINRKRPITEKSKQQLGLNLGLSLEDLQTFATTDTNQINYNQMTLDTFAVISEWYHYAILELINSKTFKSDCSWVSKRLGITTKEVSSAVERLIRIKMIEVNDNGDWIDISGKFTSNIDSNMTSIAAKKFQEQLLEKAITALKEVPLEKRNNTSMTMAINTRDLPKAQELIKDFRRSLNTFFVKSANGQSDEVYNLCIAFYPVTTDDSHGEVG